MFEDHLLPRLRRDPGTVIRTRVIPTFGLGESEVAARLGTLMDRSRSASGLPMKHDRLPRRGHDRVRAEGPGSCLRGSADAAAESLSSVWVRSGCSRIARPRWPSAWSGCSRWHRCRWWSWSRARGLLGRLIADVPGPRTCFWEDGSLFHGLKQRQVGVPERVLAEHGAVSRSMPPRWPRRACRRGGGPRPGDHELLVHPGHGRKPVGTVWIALASGSRPTFAAFRSAGAAPTSAHGRRRLWACRLRLIGRRARPSAQVGPMVDTTAGVTASPPAAVDASSSSGQRPRAACRDPRPHRQSLRNVDVRLGRCSQGPCCCRRAAEDTTLGTAAVRMCRR